MKMLTWLLGISCLLLSPLAEQVRAEHEGKLQIVLLGDSTTEGSIPRLVDKDGPHLEDVIRLLIEAEADLPRSNVINLGLSGETIRRLIDSGRYDDKVAKLPGVDYIFIRYGLNDFRKLENFETDFPRDFKELLARLRKDHPQAVLIPTTVIPYSADNTHEPINATVRKVAVEEKLQMFDLASRYARELMKGPNMLNYRRFPLDKVPEKFHALVKPFVMSKPPSVIVMDNRLDAHLGNLPGWFDDRHPNLAGYHVIGDETARFLIPLLRQRSNAPEK